MKNYTYNGQLGSVSIRTTAGVLTLQRGVTASATKELHQAAKKHPVVQALVKTGELTVTGEFAPEQVDNPLQDHAETDAVKAAAKAAAEAAQIKAEAEKVGAANPEPAIHSLNGTTVVDDPVTTQLTGGQEVHMTGEQAAAAAQSEDSPYNSQTSPAADQASTSTTDVPAPAADNSAENVTNAEPAPKPPTIPQLKKQLDEAGIQYEANAKRDELVALLPKQG